jgi:hypothetical protein
MSESKYEGGIVSESKTDEHENSKPLWRPPYPVNVTTKHLKKQWCYMGQPLVLNPKIHVVDIEEGICCYKVVNRNWKHFDYQWRFGMNQLEPKIETFNPYECANGGLYSTFFPALWLDMTNDGVIAICRIPYGAKVTWFQDKQKSDALEIIDVYETADEWADVLIEGFASIVSPLIFANMGRAWKSTRLSEAIVSHDWRLIRHVPYEMRTRKVVNCAYVSMCNERQRRIDFNSLEYDLFQTRWYCRA